MNVACIVKNSLYWVSVRNCSPGCASSDRTPSASRPPMKKKMNELITYMIPIFL